MILVTGGAGFIGANFVLDWLDCNDEPVINLDKLTYAGNLGNLASLKHDARHIFVRGDIGDRNLVLHLLSAYRPRAIVNFAAESHVDRSIHGPAEFIATNIVGTFALLDAARNYWNALTGDELAQFRFVHISTDEVYGSLGDEGLFTETAAYDPSSPYSATKAASDHLAKAWQRTYGLPVIVSNCSNNYGPYHFPEKLIPLIILNALDRKPLPVYGDGSNVRDWLYVEDHARALGIILAKGRPGVTYNIGGRNERKNIEVVRQICTWMDRLHPRNESCHELISFVTDRPGHDQRYAIDATKLETELGWRAQETFETGIEKTVRWYLERSDWWQPLRDRIYSGERLGLVKA